MKKMRITVPREIGIGRIVNDLKENWLRFDYTDDYKEKMEMQQRSVKGIYTLNHDCIPEKHHEKLRSYLYDNENNIQTLYPGKDIIFHAFDGEENRFVHLDSSKIVSYEIVIPVEEKNKDDIFLDLAKHKIQFTYNGKLFNPHVFTLNKNFIPKTYHKLLSIYMKDLWSMLSNVESLRSISFDFYVFDITASNFVSMSYVDVYNYIIVEDERSSIII